MCQEGHSLTLDFHNHMLLNLARYTVAVKYMEEVGVGGAVTSDSIDVEDLVTKMRLSVPKRIEERVPDG